MIWFYFIISQILGSSVLGVPLADRQDAETSNDNDETGLEQDPASPLAGLPGFNNMMRNYTASDKNHIPSDAAFGSCCRYVALGGHGKVGQTTLEATCVDDAEIWWRTSINLNNCIANNRGKLVYSSIGNFDKSCRPCGIDSLMPGEDILLKCNCLEKPDAVPRYTFLQIGSSVDDDFAVKLIQGRFVCGSHKGTKSPSY